MVVARVGRFRSRADPGRHRDPTDLHRTHSEPVVVLESSAAAARTAAGLVWLRTQTVVAIAVGVACL